MTHQVDNRKALGWALLITSVFFVIELTGGILANSLALLSDAGHLLSDMGALGLSYFAIWFARRPATREKTYGYYRVEILAALINGVVLALVAIFIFIEAYKRLLSPQEVNTGLMMGVAVAGLFANILVAYILHQGDYKENLNVRSAFLHVLGDILGSLGAIAAGILIWLTGIYLFDTIISIVIAIIILFSVYRLLNDTLHVLLEGTPKHLDYVEISQTIGDISGVQSIHDLHIWTVTSGFVCLSCHVVKDKREDPQEILLRINRVLKEGFGIEHTTVQVETEDLSAEELNTH